MKNIYSNIKKLKDKSKTRSINILKNDGLVILPTETVYGLAGNAYSKIAVKKIFKVKKRPKINPLIVHYHSIKDAAKDVYFTKEFLMLYNKFCPGPITFILRKKKNSDIAKNTTAGLKSLAIRFPQHKIIREILRNINFPLAMPSANKSGQVSPTCADHVKNEFEDKVTVVDGGKSRFGLESTVINLTDRFEILRPGVISSSQIRNFLKIKIKPNKKAGAIKSPGMMKYHYSPGIPVKLNVSKSDGNSAFIVIGKKFKNKKNTFNLSEKSNLEEAAKNLYKTLISIKKKNIKKFL